MFAARAKTQHSAPHAQQARIALSSFHPVVAALFFCGALLLTMFGLQPVLVAISLACALVNSVVVRGGEKTARTLCWVAPMALAVCLINPIVSRGGATLLVRIAGIGVRFESLVFGACMGAMFAAMVLWVETAAQLLPQDRLLALSSRAFPTVGLMAAMTSRLIPRLLRRFDELAAVDAASSAARASRGISKLNRASRSSGALLAWALSDSIETADLMRARGWNARSTRSSYLPYRFGHTDCVACVVLGIMLLVCALLCWHLVRAFDFYPRLSTLGSPAPYVLLVCYLLLPAAYLVLDATRWEGDVQ